MVIKNIYKDFAIQNCAQYLKLQIKKKIIPGIVFCPKLYLLIIGNKHRNTTKFISVIRN